MHAICLFLVKQPQLSLKNLIVLYFPIMEMERVTEFPHTHMDRRPTKRARMGWDVLPQIPKVWSFTSHLIDLSDPPRFLDVRIVFLLDLDLVRFLSISLCFVTNLPFVWPDLLFGILDASVFLFLDFKIIICVKFRYILMKIDYINLKIWI